MDTPHLLVLAIAVLVIVVMPRLILQSVGRASDGIAQLFVPPDRALGWPRGVQESDEPWAWREPAAPTAAADAASWEPVVEELPTVHFETDEIEPLHGDGLVVPVHAVHR